MLKTLANQNEDGTLNNETNHFYLSDASPRVVSPNRRQTRPWPVEFSTHLKSSSNTFPLIGLKGFLEPGPTR
jgi:hypothetical protein